MANRFPSFQPVPPVLNGLHTWILVSDGSRLIGFYDMDGAGWQESPSPATPTNPILVQPSGVTWAPMGYGFDSLGIIVLDQASGTLLTMNSLSEAGVQATPAMQNSSLVDVCVSGGQLYVAAGGQGLVQLQGKLALGSDFLLAQAAGAYSLGTINGVCNGGDSLYVATGVGFGNNPATIFQLSGYTWTRGSGTTLANVYNANLSGGTTTALTHPSFVDPYGVSTDSNGNLYILDRNAAVQGGSNLGGLFMVGPNFTGPVSPPLYADPTGNDKVTLNSPSGVHVNPYDNKIYIADTGNGRIVRVDDIAGTNWTHFGKQVFSATGAYAQFVGPFRIFAMTVAVDIVYRNRPVLNLGPVVELGA